VALLAALLSLWAGATTADDWPQWRGPQRDGVWRETGIIEKFASEQIPIRWRTPISSGYSGPTVADGRVYVTDRVLEPKQTERVHCLSTDDGRVLWTYAYDAPYRNVGYQAGPRASVTVHDGRAYSLGTMGHFFCFDAATGKVLWQHDLDREYQIEMPIWGIAASPLIEGDLVITQVGGADGACVVAFDRRSGKEVWRALHDQASYAAPIVTEQGGRRVLICWTGDRIVGMHPRTGEVFWQQELKPKQMVIGVATPVVEQGRLFVTSFYDGSTMLKLDPREPAAELLWRKVGTDEKHTEAIHSIISTPYLAGDYVYGVDSHGELRCLDAQNGERIWEDLTAVPKARWATIHFVRNEDKVWMFNERGELIISRLSPEGLETISRAQLIAPTTEQLAQRQGVCWAHPAFAERCVFQRNDNEIVCAELSVK
jgi:outer membrane protein assembly factor BamB